MKHAAIMFLLSILAGCARQTIPRYSPMDEFASQSTIDARNAHLQSVQAECSITMIDAANQSVQLDGVLIVQPPAMLRMRAWKLGQAVFDLTLNDEGLFQYVPRDEARQAIPATRELISNWLSILVGQTDRTAKVTMTDDVITFEKPIGSGGKEIRLFDRHTLTQMRIQVIDDRGTSRFAAEMTDYRPIEPNSVWPMRVRCVSDSGTIDLRFSGVEINSELPATAFKPPARAERLP